jgi:hypothetical protein
MRIKANVLLKQGECAAAVQELKRGVRSSDVSL